MELLEKYYYLWLDNPMELVITEFAILIGSTYGVPGSTVANSGRFTCKIVLSLINIYV